MNMPAPQPRTQAWQAICRREDLVANSGVVARLGGEQIALFYLPQHTERPVYAVQNRDPRSGANIIGRGLVGQLFGELTVAAPLYKQHFRLRDGTCLEDPGQCLKVWQARLRDGHVEVAC